MPLGEDHIKNYSAADIERYHKGLMTPAEMHAMEKAALEDPFLADAMEGYTYTDEAAAEIEDIRLRLEKRVNKGARVVPMGKPRYNWLRAAAVLVVIAGGAIVAYLQMKQTPVSNDIVKQEPKAEIKPADPVIEQMMDSIRKDTVMNAQDIASIGSTANTYSTLSTSDSTLFANFSKNKQEKIADRKYNEDSNRQVLFYNPNTDSGAIAKLDDKISSGVITPSSTAQKDAEFKKAEASNKPIPSEVLTNSNGFMKEAVIVSNRVTKKKEPVFTGKSDEYKQYRDSLNAGNYSVEDFLTKEAEPVIGWVAFNDYLRKNKRLYAVDSLESNEVIVTFKVNAKGQLSNFRIETSVNETYDAEAIRLIKEGPAWKLLKGKRAWIRVLVSF